LLKLAAGQFGSYQYELNHTSHHMPYFLTDGIYPEWAIFAKGFTAPVTDHEKYYTAVVSAIRKDIKRAFGFLKAWWHFLLHACRFWYYTDILPVVQACIILHNMVIEFERELDEEDQEYIFSPTEDNVHVQRISVQIPEYDSTVVTVQDDSYNTQLVNFLAQQDHYTNREGHSSLRSDLMQHCWDLYLSRQKSQF
jgi:hypothetical protein